jgi:hypothetical protein
MTYQTQPDVSSTCEMPPRTRSQPFRITVVRPEYGWIESPVQHVYGDHPAFQSIAAESLVAIWPRRRISTM